MIRAARPESLPAATDRFVAVEASAGTGKTFFLEHRVVDLILGGADLAQILLVTFTDKAVAELRMRIRDVLDRLSRLDADTAAADAPAWEIDDAARSRLRAAVTAFDHAPIFTIHGFCHRILIEDAFAARRLFDQSQVADEIAFDAAFEALLRSRFARNTHDRELLRAYLESGKTVDALRELLLRCARTGARSRLTFDEHAVLDLADRLRAHLATPEQRAVLLPRITGSGTGHKPTWVQALGIGMAAMPEGASAPAVLAAIDEMRGALGNVAKYLKGSAELVAAMREATTTVSLGEVIAGAFLPPVLERVAEDKAEHGQFDYDDMLALVHRALHDERGAELAARLRERTPWVMIDEFQDTDPTQWGIFRAVWLHDEARGLVLVGDPKQAIYGFRGADVHTYLRARDELLRLGATRVTLDTNRRSTAPLVEAVNRILGGSFGAPLLQGEIEYDTPVHACGDIVADASPPVTVFAMTPGNVTASRAAHAEAIGIEIEQLQAAPAQWTHRGKAPAFTLGQVMVLTRTNSDSAEIARALRARGLPCALVESDKLFDTREAQELADVLAAIASPRDRSLRLRALRTRYFDVPWADVMHVVDAPDHHPLIARLHDWAALAGRRSYETLFRRLVEDSRFAERAIVLGGGERALVNTWHLLELLLDEVARSRSDLHELVVQFRRWIEDRADRFDDRDTQRAESDGEAIRILTVHKAKGLEAPYVFVYGGTSPPPSKVKVQTLREATERLLYVDPKDPAIEERLDAESHAENQRLAYVALTRAQVRLYLPNHGKDLNADAMYHPIQRCVRAHTTGAAVDAAMFRVIEVTTGGDEAEAAPTDALAGFVAPPQPPVAELAALDGVRAGLAALSYTRLAHDVDVALVGIAATAEGLAVDPTEFHADAAPAEPVAGELPPGAASGLMLHDVLEIADLARATRTADAETWAADPLVAAQLATAARDRGLPGNVVPHAARLVHHTLTAPLALTDGGQLPPLASARRLAREVEFVFPLPGTPVRGVVRGFIDALVAWDDELWVLDYKSDALAGEDLAAAARARIEERYAVQTRLYAIAAERLRGERRLAGMLFAFVRHGITVPIRVTDATIATWTRWLEEVRT
jgi:exodeoxyribonuclease V beta subunit